MVERKSLVLTATEIKKCVINLLIVMLMHWNLFPIALRLRKGAINLSILTLLQYNLFPIA